MPARFISKAQMAGKQGFAVVFKQRLVAPHAPRLPAAKEGECVSHCCASDADRNCTGG